MILRIPVWLIAICVGAYFIAAGEFRCSREIVASGWDKSALAWTGFLPFMIPVWLFQAGCVVVPIAMVYEGYAYMWTQRTEDTFCEREKKRCTSVFRQKT